MTSRVHTLRRMAHKWDGIAREAGTTATLFEPSTIAAKCRQVEHQCQQLAADLAAEADALEGKHAS